MATFFRNLLIINCYQLSYFEPLDSKSELKQDDFAALSICLCPQEWRVQIFACDKVTEKLEEGKGCYKQTHKMQQNMLHALWVGHIIKALSPVFAEERGTSKVWQKGLFVLRLPC